MHKNSKSFFEQHKGIDILYYTEDGQHFKNEGSASASAHGRELKRNGKGGKVTEVTRKECFPDASAPVE
jgi:hypothetical protein